MDPSKIKVIVVAILATFVALYLGISAATAQIETIMWILGSAVLITCISLGRRIWLIMPFLGALAIQLRIPGQPNSLLLGQILVLAFSSILFLMRKLPYRLAWTELEFWILILTLFVAQVYLRNPVSISLFGGAMVGGRGYVLFIITLVFTLLFAGLRVPAGDLKWILRLSIIGGLCNMVISILSQWIPAVGYVTGASFERADERGFDDQVVDERAATRVDYMSGIANNMSLWITSFISPLRAMVRPLWAILLLLSLMAAAISGYRNVIVSVGLTYLIGIIYRNGFAGVVLAAFGAIGGVALIAVVNSIHPLPPNIQRSLTFLPGTWEERYKDDTLGSNEWRYEIWREVLLTDRWIQNKWFGDGLGFTAAELAAQGNDRQGARAGISGFNAHRESVLKTGDYHSGPVSTIRVIGYVGLLAFLLAQIRLAVHAHRQIIRCWGTEWLPLAFFLGIPLISGPFFFVFVFGDFKINMPGYLLAVGIIRLLESNLPLPAYVKRRREPVFLRDRQMLTQSTLPIH